MSSKTGGGAAEQRPRHGSKCVRPIAIVLRRLHIQHAVLFVFFFQAEDGIRDATVTGVQTCALPILFTVENMFIWNVLPPCVATAGAIMFLATVNWQMAAGLTLIAAVLVLAMFRLAAAGRPLHHDFADKAAAVDGEMVDVVGNMPLVWAFGGLKREYRRFDATVGREMGARRRSLLYLEKVRLFHAVITVVLTVALVAWALVLWERGSATTGEVVLVCTLGLSILHATRDLAVALVD